MAYNQSFLPVLAPGNRILGIIPIATTSFTGEETSFVVNGGTFTIAQQTPVRVSADVNQNNLSTPYMALMVTAAQERGSYQSFDFLEQQVPVQRWSLTPGGGVFKEARTTPLFGMLRGNTVTAIVVPTPAVVSAISGTVTVAWATEMASAPQFSFFEQNWVTLLQANSGNTNAANLTIGSSLVPVVLPNPTAATGVGSSVGGTLAAATYYTKVVAIDAFGAKTSASPESVGVATLGTTSSIAYTWTAVPGAVSYQLWYGTSAGTQASFFTSTTNSFTLVSTAGTAGTISTANDTGTFVKASAGKIALYVVTSSPQIVNNSISLNTVRFVKVSVAAIPAGNYLWNCTVSNTDGSTTPVILTLTVR